MTKFLFIYRDPVEKKGPQLSPEEMQDSLNSWFDWLGGGKEAGWVVEMGDALQPDVKIVQADHSVLDGPLPEAKEVVGGYSIIQADDFDQACHYARGCPIFQAGGTVEVRELANVSPSQ